MSTAVKNLHDTTGCDHYDAVKKSEAYTEIVGCCINGCPKKGKTDFTPDASHVLKANQNEKTGGRYLFPMCRSHNMTYGQVLEADGRIDSLLITGCKCGTL